MTQRRPKRILVWQQQKLESRKPIKKPYETITMAYLEDKYVEMDSTTNIKEG